MTEVHSCNDCTVLAKGLLSIHPGKMLGSISVLTVNLEKSFEEESAILFFQVNILLAVFFLTQTSKTRGVSRYILTILMVNMFLYVSHYISCKLYYR